jgi:hypothetical protein
MRKSIFFTLICFILVSITRNIQAQTSFDPAEDALDRDNTIITTAIPFVNITPDARSGAMGDAGVALSPDANAIFWNPGKLCFVEKKYGLAVSYTPWLRKLVTDISISYLSAYYKPSKEEAFGLSLLYFDLGDLQFTDQYGADMQKFSPKEYTIGATYSRALSENLGVALSLKFIHSNLSGGITNSTNPGTVAKPGNTAGGDVGIYYNKDIVISGTNANIALGGTISNMGPKISYTNNDNANFIPTNLRLGSALTTELDPYNKITFALDFNKLLVPTPPQYKVDSMGRPIISPDHIYKGKDPNRSWLSGMMGSFTDAPGGFNEEIKEFTVAAGVEYWYNDLFAARGGIFTESKYKGNRQHITLGFGIRYQVFGLDFAYLVPLRQNSPLAETLRFSLLFNFEGRVEESVTE